ncbi:AI-2E family transporter [Kiloniella laminariae]|uniref:AI-2E family transporter n=1 Tax=Kiloniella laminariae TaxID=454162 RepID=A0ABT4LJ32_9PROT|nr:AI-2E family transporter [Kiloniella laminariae]MCZ4280366.1 AI-2E family transporter [Kiloniella laminariae]
MTAGKQIRFWVIGLIIFLISVYFLRSVLLPFVAGMAVAYFLDPLCDRLEKVGLSRTLATVVVTFTFLMVVFLALVLLVPVIVGQIADLLHSLPGLLEAARGQLDKFLLIIEARVDPVNMAKLEAIFGDGLKSSAKWLSSLAAGLLDGGVAFANLMSLLVITPVVTFYLLRDWDRIVDQIDGYLPRANLEVIRKLAGQVDTTLAGFIRGQGTVCLILGIFYALGLSLSGLKFGLVLGMIAGLLSFIPFVGAGIGLVLSVGLAFFQFDSWTPVIIVAVVFFAGQFLEGNVLTPKLVGEKVGLHPVWVIFGLLAGGALFGFVGILLAVPVAAVIGVGVRFALSQYMDSTYYYGINRPAAIPNETSDKSETSENA